MRKAKPYKGYERRDAAKSKGVKKPRYNIQNLKPWKKGQTGNPLGGRAVDPALRAVKRLTNAEIAEIGSLLLNGRVDELRKIESDETETPIRAMLASVAMRAIDRRDSVALDIVLNRIAGKVKDELALSNPDGSLTKAMQMTPEERAAELAAIDARVRKTKAQG